MTAAAALPLLCLSLGGVSVKGKRVYIHWDTLGVTCMHAQTLAFFPISDSLLFIIVMAVSEARSRT